MSGRPGLVKLLLRVLAVSVLIGATRARCELVACDRVADTRQIGKALERIAHSVDPCGESAEVIAVLDTLRRCSRMSYEICTDTHIERNVFDRPMDEHGQPLRRTIGWNPGLRSELERGCDGDPAWRAGSGRQRGHGDARRYPCGHDGPCGWRARGGRRARRGAGRDRRIRADP